MSAALGSELHESQRARARAESWLSRFGSWLLVGFALLLLLPGVRTFPLFDQDEPTFAQIAREMRDSHAWVVPHINGRTAELEKPPLAFWLMSASFAVLGVNEFAARAPSILATIGLLLLVQAVGRRWFSARVGFAAGFGLLTCSMVLVAGRAAVTDMPLVLSVVAAQFACFELLRHEGMSYPWRWFALLYGALAAGTLTKGPVAVGALGLTLVAYRLAVWRRPAAWRNLKLAWGLPLLAAGVAAWAVPAMIETHGGLWGAGILQTVQRGLVPFNGRAWFVGYYPIVALLTLMPWMAFAGEGISLLRQHWNATNAYLVSWFAALPLALSFYATQLPHYMLPSFPAFFLILAQIVDSESRRRVWASVWFWSVMALYLACVAVPVAFCLATNFTPPYTVLRTVLLAGAAFAAGLAALALGFRFRRYAAMGLALVVLAASPLVAAASIRAATLATQVQALLAELPPDTQCVGYGFTLPSLLFYTPCRWSFPAGIGELRTIVQEPGPRVVVLVESNADMTDYERLRFGHRSPVPAADPDWIAILQASNYRARQIEGINFYYPSWTKMVVLYRP